jgi:CDP-diacylglycerol--serine O-phosphatidyltransferase
MNKNIKKGIYVIPTLFTCGNMAFGFLSIMMSVRGEFSIAAWFLVCAIACDMLDGRIARLTKTTSEFGVQMDSLSDLVSFGIAPAAMIYLSALTGLEKIGLAIAVLYVLCSALRLAKFNVMAQDGQVHKHFSGLPTPASAGVIISFVLSHELINSANPIMHFKIIPALAKIIPACFELMPYIVVALSLLMVSNVPYFSFKKMTFSKPKRLGLFVLILLMIFLVLAFPQNMFFIIFFVYALSGILTYVLRVLRSAKKNEKKGDADER